MKIIAKSEIYFNFIKYQKGAEIDMPQHQAEGLIAAGCAMTPGTAETEARREGKGVAVESTALDTPPATTAVKAPKGKKPGFKKK